MGLAGGLASNGGLSSSVVTERTVAAGNLGSAYTVDFASVPNQVVRITGTLNANCAITLANRATGCQALLLLIQDGTGGRTLTVSDGSASQAVTIPSGAGAFCGVQCDCPNSTDILVSPLSTPGPQGPAGTTGATGPTGPTGATGPAGTPVILPSAVAPCWDLISSGGAQVTDKILYAGGGVALSGTNSGIAAFYLDPGDSVAAAQVRVRLTVITNAVAPTRSITANLKPISTTGGASGVVPTITALGIAVCSATVTTPAATSTNHAESSLVAFPSAGFHVICYSTTGALAAGAAITLAIELQQQ